MSAGKGAALQVRMGASQLAAFRSYADQNETTMSALVLGWIEQAVAGTPPASVSPTGAPVTEIPSSGDVLAELKTQTALLQALVSQSATTPYGGTEPRRVVITEPEVMAGNLMSADDFASPPPPTTPDGYRPAEASEVVPGKEVWVVPWGCFGTVKEPPIGGVAFVQPADKGRSPNNVSCSNLMVPANA